MLLNSSVIIMGVPGSGKSTLASQLGRVNPGFKVIEEPLPPSIEHSLAEFYHDPAAHTLRTQLEFVDAWAKVFEGLSPQKHIAKMPKFLRPLANKVAMAESMLLPPSNLIIDASPLSILYHSHTARDMGWLDDDALVSIMSYYDILKQYWDAYMPSEILYYKVSPEIAMKRISNRGRPYEQSITKDYIERLIFNLEELLSAMENVTIIDGENKGFDYVSFCQFCVSKGFTIHENYSHGKLEPNCIFECGFCPN